MARDTPRYDRRTVLKGFGAGVIGLAGAGSATGFEEQSGVVPPGTARGVVEAKVEAVSPMAKFSSWRGATVGRPTTFYAKNASGGPAYVPAAYVFAIRKSGQDVGYVTASAQTDWAPILEYSTATPPTRHVEATRVTAQDRGATPTGRLLYHGGVKYGVELADGRAVNVRNDHSAPVGRGIEPSSMSFRPETVERHWDALTDSGSLSAEDVTTAATWDTIWDVPAWTEHDDGGASTTYYGSGDDEWIDWDGCVPVAASMIIAYHEGYDESDTWIREWLIDHLHDDMGTEDATGSTWPTNIDNGFDNFSNGSHSYDGTNIYIWTHPNFTKSEITDHERPFLLNMTNGGTANDRNQSYGDHTTTVVGYASDGDELELHDTWDDSSHYLAWGSWTACSYTKVTKS